MLDQTITHYFPWDESDDVAYCGVRLTAADVHSPAPTCLTCAVRQAQAEQAIEDTALPLDADEARPELDPILNAGIPAAPLSALGADLFDLARRLAQVYTVETDQVALIGLVREAQRAVRQ